MIVDNKYIMSLDKFKKLKKWLEEQGCSFVRNGKGTHQIWKTKEGKSISIPHHNIYKRNTLRQIVKMVNGTYNKFTNNKEKTELI